MTEGNDRKVTDATSSDDIAVCVEAPNETLVRLALQ
jgi:hypothetical protein